MMGGERAPRRPAADQPSHERWLVSYADFVTLLFALFATLYAISMVDAQQLEQVVLGLRVAFDDTGEPVSVDGVAEPAVDPVVDAPPESPAAPDPPDPEPEARAPDPVGDPLTSVRDRLASQLALDIGEQRVDLEMDPRGLVISIREAGLFAVASVDLSAPAREIIAQVAETLRQVDNLIRIEGHTDDVPINTPQYASNWELSTARASSVLQLFVSLGFPPGRLSVAGYGEFRPRLANDSAANRARNRRVDIVVLNPTTRAAEEPSSTGGLHD